MLPTPALGTPVEWGLANEIYNQVESQIETELECRSFVSVDNASLSSYSYSTFQHREKHGSQFFDKTLFDSSRPLPRSQIPKSLKSSQSLSKLIGSRIEKETIRSGPKNITLSEQSDIWSQKGQNETEQEYETLSTSDTEQEFDLEEDRMINIHLSRWEINSIKDLRNVDLQFRNLLIRVISDKGQNYKKLKQEFRQLQDALMEHHGYLLQELNQCGSGELLACAGTFGICVKTSAALDKLKSKKVLFKFPSFFAEKG
ncbi:hypothetical protein G9A89_010260 [Geosiphon pyriformis]|nr:hypothetical protein G9A89_010260 [Geosiphon pyriformis]